MCCTYNCGVDYQFNDNNNNNRVLYDDFIFVVWLSLSESARSEVSFALLPCCLARFQ